MFERNITFSFVFVLFSCDTSRNWHALNLFYLAQVNNFHKYCSIIFFPSSNSALSPIVTLVSTAIDDYKDKVEVKASHHMYNAFANF